MRLEDHLEELRRRLFVVVLAYLPLAALAFWRWRLVVQWILWASHGRLTHLAVLSPAEAFLTAVKIGAVGGLVLASPVIVWQLYRFVWPGLTPSERQVAGTYVPAVLLLFAVGILFGYFFFLPLVLRFVLAFTGPSVVPVFTLGQVVGFAMNLVLPWGFVFELPVLTHALARMGLVTPSFLRRNRRWAILVIVVVAAAFTPPDALSMLAMAAPMVLLYELGILVAVHGWRRHEEAVAEALRDQ
jgi:sec-independent protein translocase protein TatC